MPQQRTWILSVTALAVSLGLSACGDDDGGGDAVADGGVDAGRRDGGPPPVPGCTRESAENYDPAATVDDGSCQFTIELAVDTTALDYDRAAGVTVTGTFCSDDCPVLTDADEDEVWEGSAIVSAGTYDYRFVLAATPAVVETVPAFCRGEGSNARRVAVTDARVTLAPVAFGGCTVLPMAVDGFYAASGFFGDAGNIAVTESCPTRAGEAFGACRTWTYTRGPQAFAGAFWQYPENNFGTQPGFPVPRGATRVSFWAWGASGGERVNFIVGFPPNEGGARDGFERATGDITLTTVPTEYRVDLVGVDYDLVAGGFGWAAGLPEGAGPITFYLDDITWERVPGDLTDRRGCTDEDASNYDATATTDDGSCLYAVTFRVDMSCPDPDDAFTTVWLTGPFCSFCGDGFPLLDPDGDDVFEGTFDFPAGNLEHKFMTNNFASQEDLVDDVVAGMGGCAPVTDAATFANRRIAVDARPTVSEAVYGRCGACP